MHSRIQISAVRPFWQLEKYWSLTRGNLSGKCVSGSVISVFVFSFIVVGHCPPSLDCARERRHFCQPGSSHCGPCLDPFVENKRGKCVIRRRNHPGEYRVLPKCLSDKSGHLTGIFSTVLGSYLRHAKPTYIYLNREKLKSEKLFAKLIISNHFSISYFKSAAI